MMYLGQLLDVLDDNERVIIRSSKERSLTYVDDIPLSDARTRLSKDARKCLVSNIYSDNSEKVSRETVTVIYIRPNGYLITVE